MPERCHWAMREPMLSYHDTEWGTPLHDDRLLFEFLILEGAQAGLSWGTVLKKRGHYRAAFDNFDPLSVAAYRPDRVEALLLNPGLIRNRLKIESAVVNARAYLAVQQEFGSFDTYLWGWVNGQPIQNTWRSPQEIPSTSPQAEALSRDLKRRGFRFVGPTICYAFMQATGLVNDHSTDCFRHKLLGSA